MSSIQAFLETGNLQNIVDLYNKCAIGDFESNIETFHLSQWDEHEVKMQNGKQCCATNITFLCWAFSVEPLDDSRLLSDFPLVQLAKRFIHEPCPISRMTQQSATHALEGLEWHMFSDIFFHERSEDWLDQCTALLNLLINRIFTIIQGDLEPEIINVKAYRNITRTQNLKRIYDGYDSDNEKQKIDLSEYELDIANVNEAYIFDMDTLISTMKRRLFERTEHIILPKPSLSKLRCYVYNEIQRQKDINVVQAYKAWYEELIVSPTYTRIYRRNHGLTRLLRTSQVFMSKYDPFKMPTSTLDIITPTTERRVDMMRLATDSMFAYVSKQNNKVVQDALKHGEIYRDALRNMWVTREIECHSFTHAFVTLRLNMLQHNETHIREVDYTVFDSHIF